MFGVNWSDPQTLWLNLTNLALGIVTLLAVLTVAGSVGWELMLRWRKSHAASSLDNELQALWGSAHTLAVPELGMTMADGGEPVKPESKPDKGTRK